MDGSDQLVLALALVVVLLFGWAWSTQAECVQACLPYRGEAHTFGCFCDTTKRQSQGLD